MTLKSFDACHNPPKIHFYTWSIKCERRRGVTYKQNELEITKIDPLKQESESMIPDITDIETMPGHKIKVRLSNGKTGVFDVTPYLDRGVFTELKDYIYFSRARIEYGTVVWPNDQDFSPETIEMKMKVSG